MPTGSDERRPRANEGLTLPKSWEGFTFGPYKRFPTIQELTAQFVIMADHDPTVGQALDLVGYMVTDHLGGYQHEDEQIQELVEEQVAPFAETLVYKLLSALWAGFAVIQKTWRTDVDRWEIESLELLHPLTFFNPFRFTEIGIALDEKTKRVEKLVQYPGTMDGVPVPHRREDVIYWPRKRQLREQVFGISALQKARRAWYIKTQLENYWNTFAEKAAMITPVFGTPPGTVKNDKGEDVPLAQFVVDFYEKLTPGQALAIPKDPQEKLDFFTIMTSGDGTAFEKAVQYWDAQLYKSTLVPEMLVEEPEHGSRAQAGSMLDLFLKGLAGLMREIGGVIIEELVTPIIQHNIGEQDDYGEWVWDELQPKDLELLSRIFYNLTQGIYNAAQAGFRLTAADTDKIRETFSEILATPVEVEEAAGEEPEETEETEPIEETEEVIG